MRALVHRIYDFGIANRLLDQRDNPITRTVKRMAGRRSASKESYRTKGMILEELNRKQYTDAGIRRLWRHRVLDEAEQRDLIELAEERAELQMLEPLICGLHGVGGVDVRAMLKGSYNPTTGILSGQRHKTGQAKFAVPIAPSLKGHLDRHVVRLPPRSPLFPQFQTGVQGSPCEPKGRMDRLFSQLVADSDFAGLTFYCLRHSFISLMLAKGVAAEQVAQWVGHTSTQLTTTTYSHFLPDLSVERMASLRLFERA